MVAEARRRGHDVTAVVREPARQNGLASDGVRVVAGDVTDAVSVAELAPGHDAAIHAVAVYGEGTDPGASSSVPHGHSSPACGGP